MTGQYLSKCPIKKENKKGFLVSYIWETRTSTGFLAAGWYLLYRLKWAVNLHAIQRTVFSKCLWPCVGFFQCFWHVVVLWKSGAGVECRVEAGPRRWSVWAFSPLPALCSSFLVLRSVLTGAVLHVVFLALARITLPGRSSAHPFSVFSNAQLPA